jgi:hypothetical protein
MDSDLEFKNKYLKYKAKYTNLKKMVPTNIFATKLDRKEIETVIAKFNLSMNKIKSIYEKYTKNNIPNEELKGIIEKLESNLEPTKKTLLNTFHNIDEKTKKYTGIEAEIKRKQAAQIKDKTELENVKKNGKTMLTNFKALVAKNITEVGQVEKKFKNVDEIIAKRQAQSNISSEKKERRNSSSSVKKKSSPKANKVSNDPKNV